MAHAQIIEVVAKDLTLHNTQNRNEINISFMESTRSCFGPNQKKSLQEDEELSIQKRTNEYTQEFYGTKLLNKISSSKSILSFLTKQARSNMIIDVI